ncbi:xylose isomerase-like protein [Scheffersomyces coipomensis]|uniref:xylose isomerase-like protein n=1 Tax=Scheffersomyces coipomensis TaxID=1788519 RepID=UPI00315CE872
MHIDSNLDISIESDVNMVNNLYDTVYNGLIWLISLNMYVWLGIIFIIAVVMGFAFIREELGYGHPLFNTVIPQIDNTKQSKFKFRYRTSIATICLPGTIKQKLLAIHNSGFDGVELMFNDLNEIDPHELKQYADSLNLKIVLLQPIRNLEGWDDEVIFEQKLHELEQVFQTMQILNTNVLLICSNVDTQSSGDFPLIIRQLKQASKLAQKYGIKLAFENLSWGIYIKTFDELINTVCKVDEDNFGICIDSFHINMYQSKINQHNLTNKIFIVQFCDGGSNISQLPTTSDKDRYELVEYARRFRYFPGQGGFTDLLEQYRHLQTSNYTGYISLEVFNHDFHQFKGDIQYISDDGFRSLIWLEIEDLLQNKPFKIKGIEVNNRSWKPKLSTRPIFNHEEEAEGICSGLQLNCLKDITIIAEDADYLNLRLKYLKYDNFLIANNIIIKNDAGGANEIFSHHQIRQEQGEPELQVTKNQSIMPIVLKVLNRTEYNRLMLFCSVGLKLQKLHEEFRQDYSFNLPVNTSFGYKRHGLKSITKFDKGGNYELIGNNDTINNLDDINYTIITISIT